MDHNKIPTLYEWLGGQPVLDRLIDVFYGYAVEDALLKPLFEHMPPEHIAHVGLFVGEVFGGPKVYSERLGGHVHMIIQHFNLNITEAQRARWVQVMLTSADEIGVPSDPEFRSAFMAYIEWGTRIALLNAQPGALPPPPDSPMPLWGWGERLPYQG